MKFAFILLSLLLPSLANSAEQKPTTPAKQALNTLGKIDTESDDAATIMTVRLDHKPAWDKVAIEEHGTFLQFTMPGVFAPNPGEFIDTPGPVVAKAGVFQPKNDVASVRLFVRKEAADVLQASTLDVLDNRVVFRLDHKKLNEITSAHATTTLTGTPTEAEQVIQRTEVKTDIPEPAKLLQTQSAEAKDAKEATTIGSDVTNLKTKMIGVAIFCGVMLSILIGLHVLRPMIRKARKQDDTAAPKFQIQTISTQALSPKQKLAVVEVGGQRFLLGITPDQISLVSELQTAMMPQAVRAPAIAPVEQRMLAQAQAPAMPSTGKIIQKQRIIPAPKKPKKIETPPTVRQPKLELPAVMQEKAVTPSRINVAIGDDGIVNRGPAVAARKGQASPAVEDVTKMIREKLGKLSSLPT